MLLPFCFSPGECVHFTSGPDLLQELGWRAHRHLLSRAYSRHCNELPACLEFCDRTDACANAEATYRCMLGCSSLQSTPSFCC